MERAEQVILTNMCMVKNGQQVLVQDKVGKDAGGMIFPGGHTEKGEPIVDSVIREIKEETGLTITEPVLCGVKDWINDDGTRYVVFLFRAEKFSGELISSDEGRVFWMDTEDVLKSNWIWHMDGIMRVMFNDSPSELFLDSENDWQQVLK